MNKQHIRALINQRHRMDDALTFQTLAGLLCLVYCDRTPRNNVLRSSPWHCPFFFHFFFIFFSWVSPTCPLYSLYSRVSGTRTRRIRCTRCLVGEARPGPPRARSLLILTFFSSSPAAAPHLLAATPTTRGLHHYVVSSFIIA